MNSYATITRPTQLAAAVTKPLLALAVLLAVSALAVSVLVTPASALDNGPSINGVSPSYTVCPGQLLTLTGGAGTYGGPEFQAQFRQFTGYNPPYLAAQIAPVSNTTMHSPWSYIPDTTQVTVPTSLRAGVTYELWLSRTPMYGGRGPAVAITMRSNIQCLGSGSGTPGSAGR